MTLWTLWTAERALFPTPKFTNFVTFRHQNWDSLYIHEKVPKICYNCSKIPRIPPPHSLNVVPSLEKLCRAVVARDDHANLQPTLTQGVRVEASLFLWRIVVKIPSAILATLFMPGKIFRRACCSSPRGENTPKISLVAFLKKNWNVIGGKARDNLSWWNPLLKPSLIKLVEPWVNE